MIVRIKYIQMDDIRPITLRVRQKLDKLGKKFDYIVKAMVTFKQGANTAGNGKSCGIEVSAPGMRLYTRAYSDDFDKSLNVAMRNLKRKMAFGRPGVN